MVVVVAAAAPVAASVATATALLFGNDWQNIRSIYDLFHAVELLPLTPQVNVNLYLHYIDILVKAGRQPLRL